MCYVTFHPSKGPPEITPLLPSRDWQSHSRLALYLYHTSTLRENVICRIYMFITKQKKKLKIPLWFTGTLGHSPALWQYANWLTWRRRGGGSPVEICKCIGNLLCRLHHWIISTSELIWRMHFPSDDHCLLKMSVRNLTLHLTTSWKRTLLNQVPHSR